MKKHDKIVLLAKKLNTIEVLISKLLIDSYINHDELISINVLRDYNEIKEEMMWNILYKNNESLLCQL